MGRALGTRHPRAASRRHRSETGARRSLAAALLAAAVAGSATAHAQITLDGSLGRSGGLGGPDYLIGAELGRQVGGNLFHSFGRFNLLTGESATFFGPGSVSNIIGRVTGGSVSSIDGTIRSTIPGANLFLVNPAGMMFGANASLDVQGSFHASTADYIRFADGARFQATNPGGSTFTAAAPAAFGFLGPNPAPITVSGSQLSVLSGQSLSLVGGDLRLTGAGLAAPVGTLSLVAGAGAGEIAVPGTDPAATTMTRFGAVVIERGSTVDATGLASGSPATSVWIRGGSIVVDASAVTADNQGPDAIGQISLQADGQLSIRNMSRVESTAFGTGRAADLNLSGGSIAIADGSIGSFSLTTADAGNTTLSGGTIQLSNSFLTGGSNSGNSGSISISGTGISISDSNLNAHSAGGTGAGAITLVATGDIVISGSNLFANSSNAANGGDIRVTGRSVSVLGQSNIANGSTAGSGGNLTIIGSDFVTIDGGAAITLITTGTADTGTGKAGATKISTNGDFRLVNGFINASSFGAGDGGAITIEAGRSVTLSAPGTLSFSSLFSASGGTGNAGNITILTGDFTMAGQTSIQTNTTASGRGGNILIVASGRVSIDNLGLPGLAFIGSGPIGSTGSSSGTGGNLEIRAGSLSLGRGAFISSQSFNAGKAGDITLNIAGDVVLSGSVTAIAASATGNSDAGNITVDAGSVTIRDGAGFITSATKGDGGNITINATNRLYLHGGYMTTSVASGVGNGGNINIGRPQFIVLNSGTMVANAFGGNGGNMHMASSEFLSTPLSRIEASSQLGIAGAIVIEAPNVDVASSIAATPPAFFDASGLIRESCAVRSGEARSSLVALGRGALPMDAETSMGALYRADDLRVAEGSTGGGRNGALADAAVAHPVPSSDRLACGPVGREVAP
ncbi:MAG: filamentous hemagglutinin N-terminal domain-containing protein [Proteobacteria bacterium]|nr:filamentous hemagglutinin N-terminal domain-containing protein [Pseudomonadota bacterium]